MIDHKIPCDGSDVGQLEGASLVVFLRSSGGEGQRGLGGARLCTAGSEQACGCECVRLFRGRRGGRELEGLSVLAGSWEGVRERVGVRIGGSSAASAMRTGSMLR